MLNKTFEDFSATNSKQKARWREEGQRERDKFLRWMKNDDNFVFFSSEKA